MSEQEQSAHTAYSNWLEGTVCEACLFDPNNVRIKVWLNL
jgi:hypothetical protein